MTEKTIADYMEDIRAEASVKVLQQAHADVNNLPDKKLVLSPARRPWLPRVLSVVRHEYKKPHRLLARIPGLGYAMRWVVHLIRLPTRFHQLYHGMSDLRHRMEAVESGPLSTDSALLKTLDHLHRLQKSVGETQKHVRSAQASMIEFRQQVQHVLSHAQPTAAPAGVSAVSTNLHALDALYFAFEQRFRGPKDDILRKQSEYLPYLFATGLDFKVLPALDLGCGRGEWLSFLKKEGFLARGVDGNEFMVKEAQQSGLDVTLDDVFRYLAKVPSQSVGCVSGFHIVEHLPFELIISFLDECLRILVADGLAIFETPNPENMVVGASNFYTDLTHIRPIPPTTLSFLAENRGFHKVEVLRLAKVAEIKDYGDSHLNETLGRFYTHQDYAVIARKF